MWKVLYYNDKGSLEEQETATDFIEAKQLADNATDADGYALIYKADDTDLTTCIYNTYSTMLENQGE